MFLKYIYGYSSIKNSHVFEINIFESEIDFNQSTDWSNNLFAEISFYDETHPQKYEIEFFNNPNGNSWEEIDFYGFLAVLEEIKEKFKRINK